MIIGLKKEIVELKKHNYRWTQLFNVEKINLEKLLKNEFKINMIEHIGSTSIDSIKAKPIIDILLVVDKNTNLEKLLFKFENGGYKKSSFQPMPGETIITRRKGNKDTHYIHTVLETYDWQRYLLFRDFLKENTDIAKEYEDLKIYLAKEYKNNRKEYTAAKEDFIENILSKIRKPVFLRKKSIVIDIENTLIDVAIRKHSILQKEFGLKDISLDKVRDDSKLEAILGKDKNETRDRFFDGIFNTPESVAQYPAPLFNNAVEIIENMRKEDVNIILISSRYESFREAIDNELNQGGLNTENIAMYFRKESESIINFKTNTIKKLLEKYFILAYIGDREEDIKSAEKYNIPSIVFHTSKSQAISSFKNNMGLHVCTDWKMIGLIIGMYFKANIEIDRLRELMINNYSNWLHDIDTKIGIDVAIASILFALSGVIITSKDGLLESGNPVVTLIGMFLILIFSFVSLIFSIQGFTARNTSGDNSGNIIKVKFKQMISILAGDFKNLRIKEIDEFKKFKTKNISEQSIAHYSFFYNRYKTYEPSALWNHRFFSIIASNYSKLTAERWASIFLIWAISIMGIWLAFTCILRILQLL